MIGDRAEITNLSWVIEGALLRNEIGFRNVFLVNDLEAMAAGVPFLEGPDLLVMNEGKPEKNRPRAVIAPGTGLGEAYLTWDGTRYVSHASEGGHTDFGPTDEREKSLLEYLQKRHDHVSYELVCSGIGIPNIYSFLRDCGYHEEPGWFAERKERESDLTALIIRTALDSDASCDICRAAIDMFVSILGAEAGNLALKVLSTGGIYVGGGIPPRILPALKAGGFMDAFFRKGRLSKVLRTMPVSVILNPKAGLIGTAASGYAMLGSRMLRE